MIAAVEAALAALCGSALGFAWFAAARPSAARINIDGSPFFPADLRLTWWSAALVGAGVPALSALAAVLSLRAVQLSPLGVTRQATRKRAAWWRFVPLAAGAVSFVVTLPVLTSAAGDGAVWALAAVMALLIVGIIVIGPWLTTGVGTLLIRTGRRAGTLLAGHRLTADPAASFRAISGLVLAVFLVTLASTLSAATTAQLPDRGQLVLPAGTVGTEFADRGAGPLPTARTNALVTRLRAIPGVTAVVDLRTDTTSGPAGRTDPVRVVTRCANLRAARLARCPDPAGTVSVDAHGLAARTVGDLRTGTDADLDALPMLGLVVTTNATRGATESVRTAIESATTDDAPVLPWTVNELKGHNDHQSILVTRISNGVLLVTLLIAGCSLAVSVTGGLLVDPDRRPHRRPRGGARGHPPAAPPHLPGNSPLRIGAVRVPPPVPDGACDSRRRDRRPPAGRRAGRHRDTGRHHTDLAPLRGRPDNGLRDAAGPPRLDQVTRRDDRAGAGGSGTAWDNRSDEGEHRSLVIEESTILS